MGLSPATSSSICGCMQATKLSCHTNFLLALLRADCVTGARLQHSWPLRVLPWPWLYVKCELLAREPVSRAFFGQDEPRGLAKIDCCALQDSVMTDTTSLIRPCFRKIG